MCDNIGDTPFCSPQDGAQLRIGETVDITWNPLFFTTSPSFPSPPSEIFIQADLPLTNDINPNEVLETAGFTSSALDPHAGFFAWPILASYLPATANSTSALLSLAAPLSNSPTNGTFRRIGVGTIRFPGPRVHILRESDSESANRTSATSGAISNNNNSSSGSIIGSSAGEQTHPQQGEQSSQDIKLAIALPIALGVFTALVMVAYYFLVRHRHRSEFATALLDWWRHGRKGAGRKGYAERQSRRHRVGGGAGGGAVRLGGRDVEIKIVKTDLEGLRVNAVRMGMVGGEGLEQGWNGNVFRKEVLRQQRERI
ncbi:hypothetical protein C8A03DRAFT_17695 [Achaetomium macrosporum]|uniref:Uncharacterized protein n=1 Tax=Achaetomium macrosporum TaxID=79813 RepID=A0AAN7HC50_9PEZI|nr:hypothetical protein C8A03DRAFT_17695 [Achaetomium macrosporum]